MKNIILRDVNFAEQYREIILPFCEQHEESFYYKSSDSKELHCLYYPNKDAKAVVLAVHGFTESAVKLREMAYYLFSEGYTVFAPDLRGHGYSYKDDAPSYGVDIDDFSVYADDIASLLSGQVTSKCGALPVYAFTHSLGGTAVLTALIENDIKIDRLVLSSPMICGNCGMPVKLAKTVAKLAVKAGKGKMPAPGRCEFHPEKGNPDATCTERAALYLEMKQNDTALQTCGPVMNWVLRSIESAEKLTKPENISKLNTKMLVIRPGNDAQLLESYQDVFIELCKKAGRDITVERCRNTQHEIYQSRTQELTGYIESILRYFNE